MIHDYYAFLDKKFSVQEQFECEREANGSGFASGFVDACTVLSCRDKEVKNQARKRYLKHASESSFRLPEGFPFEPDFSRLPYPSWLGIEVSFTLETAWCSKDDRLFHVLDNPVRKDRVFGIPFMPASSWKGLLRWVCRMQAGLLDHLQKNNMKMDGWKDPSWIVHFFGNEKGEEDAFSRGALVFYPTWFGKIGYEVINPHSRVRRAGTQPIYYEVVPAETAGKLHLLYAPLPLRTGKKIINPGETLSKLVDTVEALLSAYGISAKRTAGWGTAKISRWQGFPGKQDSFQYDAASEFKQEVQKWSASKGVGNND
jgi:CRISPR-associated protein Cmr2